jgi:hypothetical protein
MHIWGRSSNLILGAALTVMVCVVSLVQTPPEYTLYLI